MPWQFTKVKNSASGKLASGISESSTSFTYQEGHNLPSSFPYKVRIDNEIIRVLSGSGNEVTNCERGVENTLPAPHNAGAVAYLNIFAGDIEELQEACSKLDTYIYVQAIPADTWVIEHNLGRYPNVTIINSSGQEVVGDVEYVSANKIILHFSSSFGGTAYLN